MTGDKNNSTHVIPAFPPVLRLTKPGPGLSPQESQDRHLDLHLVSQGVRLSIAQPDGPGEILGLSAASAAKNPDVRLQK
ncbi:hypothetical protein NQZ68_013007 [Dissostichus eleginoides]|nr:hypothetical protein NQZ68_013007 [Dissostichus eleginoides]